jgi:hypothetical protein
MSLAAWELINTNGTTISKPMEGVALLLGLEKNDKLPLDVYNFYADKGDSVLSVLQGMGATVTQSLGLKPIESLATIHDMPKLQNSIGALVFHTLMPSTLQYWISS